MRIWFSLTLFVLSILYLAYGLSTLSIFTSAGRPGPGFFPTLVGAGLVIFTAINCYKDFMERRASAAKAQQTAMEKQLSKFDDDDTNDQEEKGTNSQGELSGQRYTKDVVWAIALITLFIAVLKPLGAILSMVVFMLILLWKFNPKRMKFNVLYSVLFPLGIYLLFEVWLRAGLPEGILGY
ncbi:tripartite tricarboxylate transporter TctB family protein [Halomonas ramblicola]|uniref:tripartite tricarboxylate transporter TctB family protein n=1 Tax=Halomonas ramblicola TaxID=747349 RepID=UPI0025B4C34E|nr:tripartite tricarboxylate transporter TctB family protein [Halomonas ramblicola]MDN3520149.1 tripartite tricarboxylate transporter TctB family protein [Halomonas ramblicola]